MSSYYSKNFKTNTTALTFINDLDKNFKNKIYHDKSTFKQLNFLNFSQTLYLKKWREVV